MLQAVGGFILRDYLLSNCLRATNVNVLSLIECRYILHYCTIWLRECLMTIQVFTWFVEDFSTIFRFNSSRMYFTLVHLYRNCAFNLSLSKFLRKKKKLIYTWLQVFFFLLKVPFLQIIPSFRIKSKRLNRK